MISPFTPLEKIAKMCKSMEDLRKLLKQYNVDETNADIPISPELLQEALFKTKHLKTVTRADIQRLLSVGYPKAAKLYDLITDLPGKTPGTYLYYYPCKRKEQANARLEDRSYIALEVTPRQREMLIELDRLEYNSNHAYSRHSVRMSDLDEDAMPHTMREGCIDKKGSLFL